MVLPLRAAVWLWKESARIALEGIARVKSRMVQCSAMQRAM